MESNIFHGDPILDLGSDYDNLQHGDMYFIGFLNDYTQVAAVSLIMPVFSIMTAVSMLAWKWWLHPDCAGTRSRREETGTQLYELVYLDSHFIRSDYSRSDYSFFESFVEIPRNQ